MAEAGNRIHTMDAYREALAEIRRLRGMDLKSEDSERLSQLEAATSDFAERLRSAELEKGRPDTETH